MGGHGFAQDGVRGDCNAQQHIGVTGDGLGGGVDDHVGPQGQRVLAQRGGEGVINGRDNAQALGGTEDGGQVGDLHHGVGGGLHPQQHLGGSVVDGLGGDARSSSGLF